MAKKSLLLSLCFCIIALCLILAGNRYIPFQERLTDGDGVALNGVYKLIFIIYDEPTGGTGLWTEKHLDVSIINGMVDGIMKTKTYLDDPDGDGDETDSPYFTNHRYLEIP